MNRGIFANDGWFTIETWGVIPVSVLFLISPVLLALIFLFQNMLLILSHTLESRNAESDATQERRG